MRGRHLPALGYWWKSCGALQLFWSVLIMAAGQIQPVLGQLMMIVLTVAVGFRLREFLNLGRRDQAHFQMLQMLPLSEGKWKRMLLAGVLISLMIMELTILSLAWKFGTSIPTVLMLGLFVVVLLLMPVIDLLLIPINSEFSRFYLSLSVFAGVLLLWLQPITLPQDAQNVQKMLPLVLMMAALPILHFLWVKLRPKFKHQDSNEKEFILFAGMPVVEQWRGIHDLAEIPTSDNAAVLGSKLSLAADGLAGFFIFNNHYSRILAIFVLIWIHTLKKTGDHLYGTSQLRLLPIRFARKLRVLTLFLLRDMLLIIVIGLFLSIVPINLVNGPAVWQSFSMPVWELLIKCLCFQLFSIGCACLLYSLRESGLRTGLTWSISGFLILVMMVEELGALAVDLSGSAWAGIAAAGILLFSLSLRIKRKTQIA